MSPFEFSFPTMAFYQPSYTYEYEPAQPSLVPLFRLLDEWENANTQAQAQAQRQQSKQPAQNAQAQQQQSQASKRQSCPAQCAQPQKRPTPQTPQPSFTKAQPAVKRAAATTRAQRFSPNFDARETETAYELYGELPGAVKENINIEFTDPQTIVISGKVERKLLPFAATASSSPLPEANQIEAPATVESETPVQEEQEQERPHSPYQATVEDTDDEEFETISKVSSLSTGSRRGSSATVDTEKMMDVDNKEEVVEAQPQEEKVEEEQGRYLLQERTAGEFQRVFSFPGLVDQDGVHASLENGILSVRVPKKRIVLSKGIWIH